MSEPLPRSWATAPLGDIADIQLGKMLDKARNRGAPTPYLRNINVRWGSFNLDDLLTVPLDETERDFFSVRDGDLMVCEGGEPGRCAVWRGGETDIKYQKAIHRVRLEAGISPELIANYLRLLADAGMLEERFTGTTIKHLPRTAFMRLSIPLPPLPEQRRIVAKLDRLSARSRAARDHLARTAALAARAKQAILAAAFDSASTQDWQSTALEAVVSDALIGLVRSKTEQSDRGTPYIRMNHYDLSGKWNSDNLTYVSVTAQERSRFELRAGDVLFNTRNSTELVGKVAVWPDDKPGHVYNNNLLRIRFIQNVHPHFAFLQMIAPPFRSYLEGVKSATTSVAAIYQRSIMTAPFFIPDVGKQHEIVRRIETAFARIDRLTAEAARAAHLLDRLDERLLAKAFRGELVPQDPADEPARDLLARIRAARAAAPKARRRRKPKGAA